ncbi:MAG: polysaccharide lyase [Cyanobacteria bacterium P01_A01_bin.114]
MIGFDAAPVNHPLTGAETAQMVSAYGLGSTQSSDTSTQTRSSGGAALRAELGNNLLLQDDFEHDLSQWSSEACCNESISLSSEVKRSGTSSVKFVQTPTDKEANAGTGRYRAELKETNSIMQKGKEYWVGFSMNATVLPKDKTVLFQFHQKPDAGKSWGAPPFFIYTEDRKLYLESFVEHEISEIGSFTPGQWNDFAINVKWSRDGSNDGFIDVWHNGTLAAEVDGKNTFTKAERGASGPHIKFGSYTGTRKPGRRVLYYDNFKLGNHNASLEDVSSTAQRATAKPLPSKKPANRRDNTLSPESPLSPSRPTGRNQGRRAFVKEAENQKIGRLSDTKVVFDRAANNGRAVRLNSQASSLFFGANRPARLKNTVPNSLTIRARGQSFKGRAKMAVKINDEVVKTFKVNDGYDFYTLKGLNFRESDQISLHFPNSKSFKGKSDRRLFVDQILLR